MIKLTDLLNEVRIVPPTDKAALLNEIADHDIFLFSALTYSDSNIESFLNEVGYNDMREFADHENPEYVKLVESYLKHIKPGEIYRVTSQSHPVAGYKMVRAWGFGDDELEDLIILTKF